jgi:hypothetical protein
MRLLTHNFLQSNVKGTDKGYPLLIEGEVVVIEESPMDKDLLLKLIPNWITPSFVVLSISLLARGRPRDSQPGSTHWTCPNCPRHYREDNNYGYYWYHRR